MRLLYYPMRAALPLFAWLLLLGACAQESAISPSLEHDLDTSVTFAQLKDAADRYRGRLVLLGGEVLTAKRLKEGTRVEILQLPLGDNQRPQQDRTKSEGRFLAFKQEFLDPATLPASTRVTIAGEVTGYQTSPLDEIDYRYPTVAIKELKVWTEEEPLPAPYYYGPYSFYPPPYPYPYGPPYHPIWRPYPYWW